MALRVSLGLMVGLLVVGGPVQAARFIVPLQVDGREGLNVLSTCALSNGNFVVAWDQEPVDDAAGPKDYRYRILAPDGTPLTGELTAGTSIQVATGAVYCDPSGGFVYALRSGPYGGQADVHYARRFDNAGSPLSDAVALHSTPGEWDGAPKFCQLADGNWAAAWGNSALHTRVFDANFAPLASELVQPGTWPVGGFGIACIDSGFAVTWRDAPGCPPCDPETVRARRFDNLGAPIGASFAVGTSFGGGVGIAPIGGGAFLVGWLGAGNRTLLQRYDASGNTLGTAIYASALNTGVQDLNVLAGTPGGAALALWSTGDPDAGCAGSAAEARLIMPDGTLPAHVPLVGGSTSPFSRGGVFTMAGAINADGAMLLVHSSYEQDADSITVYGDTYPTYTGNTVGNGRVDAVCGEQCDDGNQLSCDGCSAGALVEAGAACGDGVPSATCSEECDDGNTVAGDGCGECRTEVTTSDTVPPGGTVASGTAPSVSQPVVTAITSPTGGSIEILETGAGPTTGFQALDRVVVISAPPASVSQPLQLNFSFANALLPDGVDETNLEIRRNGVVLPECTGAPEAIPDPCVSQRSAIPDGVQVTALSSAASEWSFGVPLCDPVPRSDCRAPGQSALALSDAADDAKDKFAWSWKKGEATSVADFGDPRRSASYAVCVYDGGGLVASSSIAPGGTCDGEPCWAVRKGAKGFKGRRFETDGKSAIALSTGAAGKASIKFKAGGSAAEITPLPFTPPVIAQLVHTDSSTCWSDTYSGEEVAKNLAPEGKTATFKAKAKN